MRLTDADLDANRNAYSESELIANIDTLSLFQILVTQHISADFVWTYIWDPEDRYMKDEYYDDIYLHEVLYYQRHLTKETLLYIFLDELNYDDVFLLKLLLAG